MKKKMQKLMLKAMLTVFAVSMVCCTVLTGMPQAAAAEASAAAAVGGLERISYGEIRLNTSGIVDPVRVENSSYGEGAYYMKPGSYVYYGSVYDHASDSYVPILWRVLDNDHDSAGGEGAMFLFSENVLTTTERFSSSSDDDNIAYKYETEYDDTFIPLFWNGRFEHTYNGSYMATHQYPVRYFLSREHYWNYMTSSNPLSLGTNVYELSAIRPVTKDDSTEMIVDGFGMLDANNTFDVTIENGTITFTPTGANQQTFRYTNTDNVLTITREDETVVTNGREMSFLFDQNGNPAVMMHHVTGGATELWDVNVYQLTRATGTDGHFEGTYTAKQSYWITGNLHFYGRDKIINGENTSHDYFYLVGHAYTDPVNNPTLKNSYIFPLSVAELEKYVANYHKAPGLMATTLIGGNPAPWLLRTAYDNDLALSDRVGYVQKNGFVADTDADTAMGGRYGMNLEISDIAYTRRVGADNVWSLGITEPAYQGTSDLFEASIDDVTVADGKYQVTINYKNAITSYTDYMIDHEHEYISAMILRNDRVVYYGHVAEVPETEIGYNGIDPNTHSATFTLPDYEPGDQLVVFWERETDDGRMTSFVSNMVYIDCIHMPGTSVATCVDYKTCIYCEDEEGNPTKFGHLDADNHAVEISWEKTDSTAAKWEHWKTCSACKATWDKEDCVVEADCTTVTAPCACGRSELDPNDHSFNGNGYCIHTPTHYQPATLKDGVYVIQNEGQLLWFASQVNSGQAELDARLEVENGALSFTGFDFMPIGTSAFPYTGTFDGNGVVISDVRVVNADVPGALVGFFGHVAGAQISNLVLIHSEFTDELGTAGAIAAYAAEGTTIQNSFAYVQTPLVGSGAATVENSFYLADAAGENGARTAEQFASGELAFLMGSAWGQSIDTDVYPVFGGDAVYQITDCQGVHRYSNSAQGVGVHTFTAVQGYIWNDNYTACDATLQCADCEATATVPCKINSWFYGGVRAEYRAEVELSTGTVGSDPIVFIMKSIKDVTAVEVVQKTFDGVSVAATELMNNTQMKYGDVPANREYDAYLVPTGTVQLITEGEITSVEMTELQKVTSQSATVANTYDLVVIGRGNYAYQAAIFERVLIIDKAKLTLVINPNDRPADGTTDLTYEASFAEETMLHLDWLQISLSDVPSAAVGAYELSVNLEYLLGTGQYIYYNDGYRDVYFQDENGEYIKKYNYEGFKESVELTYPETVTFRILQRIVVEIENKNWAEEYLVTEENGNPIHQIRIPYGTPIPTPTADNFTVDEGSTLSFEWYRNTGEWVWDEELKDTIPVLKRLGQPPVNAGKYVLRVIGSETEDYVSSYLDIEFYITPLQLGIELITDGYTYENNEYHDWYVVKNTQPLIPFKVTGLAPNDTLESAGIDTLVYLDDRYAYTYDTITALYPNALIYDYQLHAGTLRGVNGAENYESANRTIIIVRVFDEAPVPESATHSWDNTDKAVTIQVGHPAASHAGTEGVEYIYRATVTHEELGTVFETDSYTDELFFSYDVTKEGVYTAVVEAHAGDENWVEVLRLEYTVSIRNTLTGETVSSIKDIGKYEVTVTATEGDITNTAEVTVNRELRILVKETSFNLTDSPEDIAYAIENHVFEAGYLPMLGHTIKDLDYTVNAEYGEITVSGWTIVDENGNDVSDLYSVDTIIYSWEHTIGGLNTVHIFDSPCDADCNIRGCTVTRAPEPHVGGTATCVARAVCDACGEFYGNPDEDNHVSEVEIHVPNQHNDLMHNLVHACCGKVIETLPHEVTVAATCTDKAICKVCHSEGISFGELNPDNHTSDEYTYTSDGSYTHSVYHACCGAFIEHRNHVGGDATCMTQAVCEHCDASYGPLDADDHEQPEGATYVADGATHLATYPCCGVTVREEHSGGVATCQAQATCQHCSTPYGDLDPTNHASDQFTYALSPTSRSRHTVSHSCCGVLVRTETHSGGEATCTEKALCEHCGTAYGQKDPTNHADEGFLYAVNKFDPTLHDKIHVCCGEQAASEAHSGGTAGCDAPAVCAGCGVHYGEMIEHTYDHDCDYTCNVCNEQTRAMSFLTDEDGNGVCDTCGTIHEFDNSAPGEAAPDEAVIPDTSVKEEEGEPASDPEGT